MLLIAFEILEKAALRELVLFQKQNIWGVISCFWECKELLGTAVVFMLFWTVQNNLLYICSKSLMKALKQNRLTLL